MTEISHNPQKSLSVTVDASKLESGRGYRLQIASNTSVEDLDLPFAEVRISWAHQAEGGDEYFPYPRRGGSWRAAISRVGQSAHIEFRMPPAGLIRFEAITARGTSANLDDYALHLRPIGPGVPAQVVRAISDISSMAQDRCRILDVRQWTDGLIPLPRRRVGPRSPAGVPWEDRAQSVAFVGSRELREELAFDCEVSPVDEQAWPHSLRPGRFDYLLIEPVLHVDHKSWRYVMARSGERSAMRKLLRHCQHIDLPIVLWLRVEPELYEEFSWLVPLCDLVYAIDPLIQRMVAREHPESDPQLLPPCIQPRLHNPFGNRSTRRLEKELHNKVLFDGWWRLASSTRDRIVRALQSERLLVSESEWEFSFTRLDTLPEYRWNALGCLDPIEKSLISRLVGAEVFLPDDTLPSWRRDQSMLRAAASGSLVLFRNEGLSSSLIEEGLCWHGNDAELLGALPSIVDHPLERSRWQHRVTRDVLERHTYRARLSRIAADLGVEADPPAKPRVACLLVSMRPWLLDACIERFQNDVYPEKELIIVVHGSPTTAREMAARAVGAGKVQVHQLGKSRSLGACLNYAAQQTDAPFWAKFDDDDLYGPRYLTDMMLYQQVADSSLLAKPPAFIYLEGPDELRWHPQRASRAWTHHPAKGSDLTAGIAGGTLLGKHSLLQETPFSELRRGGSDSDFVLRARQAGHDLLVTDPFNFAFFRSARAGFHTWDTGSEKLRKKSMSVGDASSLSATVFV